MAQAADVIYDIRCCMADLGSAEGHPDAVELASLCSGKNLMHAERDILRFAGRKGLVPAELYTVEVEVSTPDGLNRQTVPVPILLPHELFAAMYAAGPERWEKSVLGSTEEAAEYWRTHAAHEWYANHPVSCMADRHKVVPIGFWGDGARFTTHDSLECFSWNSLLAKGPPLDTRFLAACVPTTLCLPQTLQQLCAPLAWSFAVMLDGTWPTKSHQGAEWRPNSRRWAMGGSPLAGGWRAAFVEARGDWEFLVKLWRIQGYAHNSLCHLCLAAKTDGPLNFADFSLGAQWRRERRTHMEFMDGHRLSEHNPLVRVPGFHLSMLRIDVMHSIHLGLGRFFNAEALVFLSREGRWDADLDGSLRLAWGDFKRWCHQHGIMTTQRVFSTKRIGPAGWLSGKEFPELLTKAWNSRLVSAWLAEELGHWVTNHHSDSASLIATLGGSLASAYWLMENNPRMLAEHLAQELADSLDNVLLCWSALAKTALQQERLAWPIRPKWHFMSHLAEVIRSDKENPRFYHCYRDEDAIGTVIKVAATCHRSTVSGAVLSKYLLRLGLRWKGFTTAKFGRARQRELPLTRRGLRRTRCP